MLLHYGRMDVHFFQPGAAVGIYEKYRDDPHFAEQKAYIEWMFSQYHGYEDTHFLRDARNHFWERLWEMHLHVTLAQKGFSLLPTQDDMLDSKVQLDDERVIWIEATLPRRGDGANSAPVREEYQGDIDRYIDPIIPRITQALERKRDQITTKALTDPVVVAITSADVDDLAGGTDLDIIEGILFGRGRLQMNRLGEMSYASKKPVFNSSGAPIPISLFEDDSYCTVSAVLYRNRHPAVTPVEHDGDILIIHNHKATYPIAPELFAIGHHRWWDKKEGKLKGCDFRAIKH